MTEVSTSRQLLSTQRSQEKVVVELFFILDQALTEKVVVKRTSQRKRFRSTFRFLLIRGHLNLKHSNKTY